MPDTPPPNLLVMASKVAPLMKLSEIYLMSSHFDRGKLVPIGDTLDLSLDNKFKVTHDFDENAKLLNVEVRFFVRSTYGEEQELFKAETAYLAIYTCNSADAVDPANMFAFARMNGVYNCWPYWREYLQNTTSRMGLPPVTLPLITGNKIQALLLKDLEEMFREIGKFVAEAEKKIGELRGPDSSD